jgi:hypothetical protein
MKSMKIARLLGITLVISLLMVAIPASPALAVYDMLVSPTSGQIGTTITINGSSFVPTSNPADPQYVIVYFSSQNVVVGSLVGTDVTIYKTVFQAQTTASGTFTGTFQIPSKFNDNSDVGSGTHYLYAAQHTAPTQILGKATFTVVGGDISLNPLTGIVDSPLVITGDNFAASQSITVQFDGVTVPIEEGNTTTDTNGDFTSTILVPESKAGSHDITVTIAGYSAMAQFTVEPDIIIFPQSGEVGDSISISGTGFARRPKLVDIYFNNIFIQQAQTDTLGSFYIPAFEIPDLGLSQGTYYIEAEDDDLNLASAAFTLNAITPTTTPPTTTPPTTTPDETSLTLFYSGNYVGSLIVIGGTGFTPNGTAVLKYDDELITSQEIGADGTFTAQFDAPPSAGGDHIITVTDGVNTNQVTFTVETDSPSSPAPLEPGMGARVKSPVTFDWEDVNDESDSTPITYTLQIASDSGFGAGSILIEKTGLSESEYELTAEDMLKLPGRSTPYYWHVNAVDAAMNASAWSGYGEFYISPPFSFPTWAIIVLSIFGALIFFGVGYWLGRRTAFFY